MARRKNRVPNLPRVVRAVVRNRAVAEIAFGDGGVIVPGSVSWLVDPTGVSGPDREAAAFHVVRVANLDPKVDHARVYDAIWSAAPKREG